MLVLRSYFPLQVLRTEFITVFAKEGKYGEAPWANVDYLDLAFRADVNKTLFGQSFLSVTLDEAHNFRNHGTKHLAALEILDNTIIRLVLSATPLQTATKDLAAMGRLTGIPHFLSDDAWEEEKEDTRSLRRAREGKEPSADNDEENDQDQVKLCQIAIAERMNRQSKGHVLRRTLNSLNWEGHPLVPLPPCETIHAYLDLTPRELKIITANGQSLKETVGTANMATKLFTKGFYMEYRTSVVYARERPNADLPVFKSLDEWLKVKSTKVDTAARLCNYLLTRDGLPPPTFKDGTVEFPAIPPLRKGETATQECKIVFELYGIKVLALNGSLSYEKRAGIVRKFRRDPTLRVLAVSSIGTTGINLAFCRAVIFLVRCFNSLLFHALIGR
ncbi:hypothetical protein BJ912DRAFT_868663 [Pholiota molesta]|nr:hypothetical protein BJ912DRAFT_868663 [Pholiota molesta]